MWILIVLAAILLLPHRQTPLKDRVRTVLELVHIFRGCLFYFFIFFRIKRDIEQILKELLPTNDTNDPTIPDKDGKFNPLWPSVIIQNRLNGLHTVH